MCHSVVPFTNWTLQIPMDFPPSIPFTVKKSPFIHCTEILADPMDPLHCSLLPGPKIDVPLKPPHHIPLCWDADPNSQSALPKCVWGCCSLLGLAAFPPLPSLCFQWIQLLLPQHNLHLLPTSPFSSNDWIYHRQEILITSCVISLKTLASSGSCLPVQPFLQVFHRYCSSRS